MSINKVDNDGDGPIMTRPASNAYREGYDRIFGKKDLCEQSLEDAIIAINKECAEKGVVIAIKPTHWRMPDRIEMSMPKDCKLGV